MCERVHNLKIGYFITSDDVFLSHQTHQNLLCAMVSQGESRMKSNPLIGFSFIVFVKPARVESVSAITFRNCCFVWALSEISMQVSKRWRLN